MPDSLQKVYPSCCCDGSTDERLQTRSSVLCPNETKSINSLEFAEDLINKSKERCHNPTQSLQLLSCGAGALKKQASVASAIASCLHLFILSVTLHFLPCLPESGSERPPSNKKIPQEHDFIINNCAKGSDKEVAICCDGEGDTKSKKSTGKTIQNNSSGSIVKANSGITLPFRKQTNGDDDEDDDENRNRKRKLSRVPCSKSQLEPDNDEGHNDDDDGNSTERGNLDDSFHSDCDDCIKNAGYGIDNDCHSNPNDGDENSHPDTEDGCHSAHDDGDENSGYGIDGNGFQSHPNDADKYSGSVTKDGYHPDCNNDGGEDAVTKDGYHPDCNDAGEDAVTKDGYYPDCNDTGEYAVTKDGYHLDCNNNGGEDAVLATEESCQSSLDDDDDNDDENIAHFELNDHSLPYDASSPSFPITQYEIFEFIREVSLQSSSLIDPWPPNNDLSWASNSIRNVPRGVHSFSASIHQSSLSLGQERPSGLTILHRFDENILGVQNGRYDEGFEWRKVREDIAYLGGGAFGKCYLITDMKTNKLLAIKKIPSRKYDPSELEIWSKLSGQNIRCLDLFGAVRDDQFVTIFMEYMEEGSLANLLEHQESGHLDERGCIYILQEVMEAVKFLHSLSVIHCDIKGENVFTNTTLTRIKLGDYGSAIQLPLGLECIRLQKTINGTEPFMSPEACRGEEISFSIDIWSCACLAIQILTGKPLFHDFTGSVLYKVATLEQPPPLPRCSDGMRAMLTDMFALNPSERPSAKELLNYPILSEENCQLPIQMPNESIEHDNVAEHGEQLSVHVNGELQPANCSRLQLHSDVPDDSINKEHVPLNVHDVNNMAEHSEQLLPEHEELHQLQSELILSLSLDGANVTDYLRMASQTDGPAVNDEGDASDEDSDPCYNDYVPMNDGASSFAVGTYSIKDLTKVVFYNDKNELLFEVREKASCTVGRLAAKLHGQIKEKDVNLDCFAVQSSANTVLDADQIIGHTRLSLFLQRASEEDWYRKWKWRVDLHGNIQRNDRVMA